MTPSQEANQTGTWNIAAFVGSLITNAVVGALVGKHLDSSWWVLLITLPLITTVILVVPKKGPLHRDALGTSILGRISAALMLVIYIGLSIFLTASPAGEVTVLFSVAFIGAALTILCWHSLRVTRSPAEVIFGPVFLLIGVAIIASPLEALKHQPSNISWNWWSNLTTEGELLLSIGLRIQGVSYIVISSLIMFFGLKALIFDHPRWIGRAFLLGVLPVPINNIASTMRQESANFWIEQLPGYLGALFMALILLPIPILLTFGPHSYSSTLLTPKSLDPSPVIPPAIQNILGISLFLAGICLSVLSFWLYRDWPTLYIAAGTLFGLALTVTGCTLVASQSVTQSAIRAFWERITKPR